MDINEFLDNQGLTLKHYGVRGMKWGSRKSDDAPMDQLGNETTGGGGEMDVEDVDGLVSGSSSFQMSSGGIQLLAEYKNKRGSMERFMNKMFDHKIEVKRGANRRQESRQGAVNKFVDKLIHPFKASKPEIKNTYTVTSIVGRDGTRYK